MCFPFDIFSSWRYLVIDVLSNRRFLLFDDLSQLMFFTFNIFSHLAFFLSTFCPSTFFTVDVLLVNQLYYLWAHLIWWDGPFNDLIILNFHILGTECGRINTLVDLKTHAFSDQSLLSPLRVLSDYSLKKNFWRDLIKSTELMPLGAGGNSINWVV
jgi:hypothetical protein